MALIFGSTWIVNTVVFSAVLVMILAANLFVLAVLKESTRPLAVAAIRKRLGGSFTPQQVRRILERNAPKVSVTDERPATYRLR